MSWSCTLAVICAVIVGATVGAITMAIFATTAKEMQ